MVGEKIKQARKGKGFSQVELASIVGIAQASLSSIESGKSEPLKKTLIALAKALGDNFDDPSLDEHIVGHDTAPPSKREIAKELTVEELISLKFGGSGETRTKTQMRALAQLLDAEIAKEERIMNYPVRTEK